LPCTSQDIRWKLFFFFTEALLYAMRIGDDNPGVSPPPRPSDNRRPGVASKLPPSDLGYESGDEAAVEADVEALSATPPGEKGEGDVIEALLLEMDDVGPLSRLFRASKVGVEESLPLSISLSVCRSGLLRPLSIPCGDHGFVNGTNGDVGGTRDLGRESGKTERYLSWMFRS
jgi:hypothetical protein